jgi:hypothetical protein
MQFKIIYFNTILKKNIVNDIFYTIFFNKDFRGVNYIIFKKILQIHSLLLLLIKIKRQYISIIYRGLYLKGVYILTFSVIS